MDDLIAFLRARLDEDERDAKARRGIFPSPSVQDDGYVWLHIRPGGNAVITRYPRPVEGYDDMAKLRNWADTEHGWTRERVLAEVEAKREVVNAYERIVAEFQDSGPAMVSYDRLVGSVSSLRTALELLTLPYADHPNYRDMWRP